jgi:hypothetical protein
MGESATGLLNRDTRTNNRLDEGAIRKQLKTCCPVRRLRRSHSFAASYAT